MRLLESLALVVALARAQEAGWQSNQVNTTMCQWQEPRVGVIRDTVYIDGGYLYWWAGLSDGTATPVIDGNPDGIIYFLNFSTPFNTTQNLTDVMGFNKKQVGTLGQNFYDGAMFANDDEYYTYGGLVTSTAELKSPPADDTEGWEQYWYGAQGKKFTPGVWDNTLTNGTTRYVTGGGGVSVPSEDMGFYFSGLQAPSGGPIFYPGTGNGSTTADVVSNSLISVNMTVQRSEVWDNKTLPSNVPGRANPELVWIPQGKQGLLVAIGGVIDPIYAYANLSLSPSQMVASNATSPTFMTTVSVYDIASNSWYNQQTTGTFPPALTQGCTVVASAQDGSSHNIYWYGGFSGIDLTLPFSDDVYVLSLPSFIWTKTYSGNDKHGRAGHKCVKPYPDQMFIIGGYTQAGSGPITCVDGNIIQILNLSTSGFIDSYNPTVWSNYTVPVMVTAVIGGSATGGATKVATWNNQTLGNIFSSANAYDTSKITNWYPYGVARANTTNPRPPATTITATTSSKLPKWVPPVLGVVLGLVFLSAVGVFFLLYKKRRYLRSNPDAMTDTTDQNHTHIFSWLRSTPVGDAKAPTVTSDESGSPDMESPFGNSRHPSNLGAHHSAVEAGSNQLHELMDTSQPQEMSAAEASAGTGFAFVAATTLNKKRGVGRTKPSRTTSEASQSTVSDISSPVVSPTTPGRPDSPSLGGAAGAEAFSKGHSKVGSEISDASGDVSGDGSRVVSGVSATSVERKGLRRLSPDPSSPGDGLSPHGVALMPGGGVSPPTPRDGEEADYVSAPGSGFTSPGGASPGGSKSRGSVGRVGGASRGVSGGRRSNFGEDL